MMRPTSRRTARHRACERKRGGRQSARASDRADPGRAEHQAACRHGRQGTAPEVLHHCRSGQRLHRSRSAAGQPARCRMADCQPGLRCRLVQGSVERQRDKAMHPRPEVTQQGRTLRQAPLQTAQPHRDHVRQAQGLAPRRYPIRPMCEDLPVRHRPRRNRLDLTLTINETGAWSLLDRNLAKFARNQSPEHFNRQPHPHPFLPLQERDVPSGYNHLTQSASQT